MAIAPNPEMDARTNTGEPMRYTVQFVINDLKPTNRIHSHKYSTSRHITELHF